VRSGIFLLWQPLVRSLCVQPTIGAHPSNTSSIQPLLLFCSTSSSSVHPSPNPTFSPSISLSIMSAAVVDLRIHNDKVVCAQHKKEVCSECHQSFFAINDLTRHLNATNGQIPPPGAVLPLRSQQIAKMREDGNTHFRAQRHEEAIVAYTNAINIAFDRPLWEPTGLAREELAVLLCNRAAAYIARKEWVNAYVDAEGAIELKRPWSKGHFRLGKALFGMGRYEEGIEALQLGLMFDPQSAEIQKALKEAETALAAQEVAEE
jgi:translocation protein SEC72